MFHTGIPAGAAGQQLGSVFSANHPSGLHGLAASGNTAKVGFGVAQAFASFLDYPLQILVSNVCVK